jgi:hypothetical protein
MPRDFFKRAPADALLVSGTAITDVQSSLNATSAFNVATDGIFGQQNSRRAIRLPACTLPGDNRHGH